MVPAIAHAEDGKRGTGSFVLENDVFYGNDRNYTNGVRFSWLAGPEATPDWVLRAAHRFPLFPEDGTVRTGYAFGQNMYTPPDITVADPLPNTHPYAGWLYGSVAVIAETGRRRLDQLDLTIGVVGPASLARQTQRLVHEVTGAPTPQGWGTQLKNEPGIVLTYQRSWRGYAVKTWHGFDIDVTPHAGGAIGNVHTYVNTGLTVRFGDRLPFDYGPPRIQPTVPGSGFYLPQHDFGWYLFAGVDGRGVARNIFLDGNTFHDSRSVDKETWVGDLQFGFVLAWRQVRLSYTHVSRSQQFKGREGRDKFGAVSISIPF